MSVLITSNYDTLEGLEKEAIDAIHIDGICGTGCKKCKVDEPRLLTPEQRQDALDLVARRRRAFSKPPYKTPGPAHGLQVRLDLKPGATSFRMPPARHGEVGDKTARIRGYD